VVQELNEGEPVYLKGNLAHGSGIGFNLVGGTANENGNAGQADLVSVVGNVASRVSGEL
jgi:hypothetical protein